MGVGCSFLTAGAGTLACGALAGALASGITSALKGKSLGEIALSALGGAVLGAAGGALGSVGGAAISTAASSFGKTAIMYALGGSRQALANSARTGLSHTGKVAAQEVKNLFNAEARELLTPSGMRGMIEFHRTIRMDLAPTKVGGLYARMFRDNAPKVLPAGTLEGFVPSNFGEPLGFQLDNFIQGSLGKLFGG